MKAYLVGSLLKGQLTLVVERKAGEVVKKSYVNLRARGAVLETINTQAAKGGMIRLSGDLDVEKVNGMDAPFLSVKSARVVKEGTEHSSMLVGTGNVTRDSEVKELQSEWRVLNYGLASNRMVDGKQKSSFFNVSDFAKLKTDGSCRLNNLAPHIKKGKGLLIIGQLDVQTWPDRDEPEKQHISVNVILDDFEFLPGKKQEEQRDETPAYVKVAGDEQIPSYIGKEATQESIAGAESLPEIEIAEDEIPF